MKDSSPPTNVVKLTDYMNTGIKRNVNTQKLNKQVKIDHPLFRTQMGDYLDVSSSPPAGSLHPARDRIFESFPVVTTDDSYYKQEFDTIYSPFTFHADPFWLTDASGCFNSSWPAFSIMYWVLREKPKVMMHYNDAKIISSKSDYTKVRNKFNKVFERVIKGRGNGQVYGYCSVDEMIRMGTLFFILMETADWSEGLVIDENKRFSNGWCGRQKDIHLSKRKVKQYSRKLKNVYMSDLNWKEFIFRYMNYTDESTLWYFSLPPFFNADYQAKVQKDNSSHNWFTESNFVELVDLCKSIDRRGGFVYILFENKYQNDQLIEEQLRFKQVFGDSTYRENPDDFYYYDNFSADKFDKYGLITNYKLFKDRYDFFV